jgi:tetratricopeptide (TPR) repeat protein
MKKLTPFALLLLAANLSAQDASQQIDPVTADITTDAVVVPDTPAPELELAADADPLAEQVQAAPQQEQTVPVAAEEAADEQDSPDTATVSFGLPADATAEEELIYQYDRYVQLMKDRVYDEADSVAKRVVELAITVKGPKSTDFAKALTNLAIVQHRTEQYDAAQQNFESAIEIIEDNEDQLDGQLVNPLRGLGAAQLESGRPDKANASFRRAVHVTHVNMGPHNLDQINILESLSETQLRLGEVDDAKQIQDRIYALNERAYAEDAMAMIPALMRRADWQHRAGFINEQRTTLRRAVRIIETIGGKNDMRLVEPLTQLGQSFFYVDLSGTPSYANSSVSTGETYFKRALRIASENPAANWEMIAATSLALGDYYMYLQNIKQAYRIYAATWSDLSSTDEQLAFRKANLEQYVVLRSDPIPDFVSQPGREIPNGQEVPYLQGTITMKYDVSEGGRATNLKIVEAFPREFIEMQRSVQRGLRRRIYRPKHENAEAVSSEDQVLVHRFFYRQADLDEVIAQAEAESEDT